MLIDSPPQKKRDRKKKKVSCEDTVRNGSALFTINVTWNPSIREVENSLPLFLQKVTEHEISFFFNKA